jgi:hypothetical protein
MMTKLEERVIGAIDRLADRLDRVIEAGWHHARRRDVLVRSGRNEF